MSPPIHNVILSD